MVDKAEAMGGAKVAFLGLGAMGFGMATSLLRAGFTVQGYDISETQLTKFREAGGIASSSPAETTEGVNIVVLAVVNSAQVDEALFGPKGVVSAAAKGTLIIVCSTVAPAYIQDLEKRLAGLLLLDAPISGGAVKAAAGTLTIMASGSADALEIAKPVLSGMSEKLYTVDGGIGSGSKMKLVNNLLFGIHLATAAEAIALGARAGLNVRNLFDIISTAAGNSWAFSNRVPHMLDNDYSPKSALDLLAKDFGIILEEAKGLKFPLPLGTAANQQVLLGTACGFGRDDDAAVVKIWEKTMGLSVATPVTTEGSGKGEVPEEPTVENSVVPDRVAFIGLGAMGFGMASWLVHEKFTVCGYDVYPPSLERFEKVGGISSSSPEEAVKGAQVVVLMVTNQDQAQSVLYGPQGAVPALANGAVVVLCSTVSPAYVRQLEGQLTGEGRDLVLVDAPVSGGTGRAANGTLTIMAAGSKTAFHRAGSVLKAMSANLYIIPGGIGAGSTVKMVNQLLAGVHVASSAEGIAFGARLGLNTRVVFDIVSNSSGSSWMFMNRVPHMLDDDYTPYSALDIFIKDLGIVSSEAKRLNLPAPMASTALQQFLSGSAAGFGRQDDAALVKVFEMITGVKVASPKVPLPIQGGATNNTSKFTKFEKLEKENTLQALPKEWPEDAVEEVLKVEKEGRAKVLVVLDDDPTGTQTVNGVTVLTEWSIGTLRKEFESSPDCFFILTNSRALSTDEATALTKEICKNVDEAATAAGNAGYTIVLRGDSTLRGHFPQEADAAASVIGEVDAWIICPFFLQGGRYTINDVHYVADGNTLVPAGDTEFAKDAVFGYKASNLREWVEEKTGGRWATKDVASVSIETLRKGGPSAVCDQLCKLPQGSVCVVNAASNRDIEVFAAGMIQAEAKGKRFLCRTAAAFVSARIGHRPLLVNPHDLGVDSHPSGHNGGLVVVGSYVPKTTTQVEELRAQCGDFLESITVSVSTLAKGSVKERELEITQTARIADHLLSTGRDTLIMTSRELVTGSSDKENLDIGSKVSSALVEIVSRIKTRPRYLLAKGGITSSDLATKAMGARRAEVAGQALPGVPLWKLGPGSRHPNIPYIVFPGNVGGPDALAEVVKKWSRPAKSSTKDILMAAEEGKYAVGAFNVYNLEGVMAVVAAAEAEKSPAILQIHPGSLGHGGKPLVACCVAAAKTAQVPLAVHLDHGSDEHAIMEALELGFDSVMVDGSHLPFEENMAFTNRVVKEARVRGLSVEAEIGRLSGTEDGLTVEEYEARLTSVDQAEKFLKSTQVDALAVCIGNVHGKYPPSGPNLDLKLLEELHGVATANKAVLVLHGASGIATDLVKACIDRGVRKFNVNTEVRSAYMQSLATPKKDLVDVMGSSVAAMQAVAAEKMKIFGSSGKAQ
ncbi:hypothetical protein M758_3G227500 [Ceratodon purpureus]|nr:hypothetical protein M758_3G227500 [Ceratodon purpureus]